MDVDQVVREAVRDSAGLVEGPPLRLAMASAGVAGARQGNRRRGHLLPAVAGAVVALLAAYVALTLTGAPPARAADTGTYAVGQGCWFVRDATGLHFHVGGWYHGLPALCTSERREAAPGR